MSKIIDILSSKSNVRMLKGATDDQIQDAESALGITFADDYKEYVSHFGAIQFDGRELTGVCAVKRLDVVVVTKAMRELNPDHLQDLYVVEEANVDGIVFWQSTTGEVFQTLMDEPPVKVAATLSEFIELIGG